MQRAITIALLIGVIAACGSSRAGSSTSTSTSMSGSHPAFDIVLDDDGLKLPPGPTLAGVYRVSFEDRRSHRVVGEHVSVRFRPSGPYIELDRVSAGFSDDVTLLQNLIVYLAIDDVTRAVPIENQLDIRPTPQYSSPVT
jgi:hypothetical protein